MADKAGAIGRLVVAAALVALGWFGHELLGSRPKVAGRKASAVPYVAVAPAALERFNPAEEFVGHVEPVQEVDLLPQIEGYLREVKFAEGDEVKAGDLLFEIDDERYRAADGVARAELVQAKSKVAESEAAVERSERYLKRLRAADDRGVTRTDMDSAETGLAADRAALASARAAVSMAEARLAATAFDLKHTRITAPISGRIGKSLRHAGDFVSPSKGALARIVQVDPVRVNFPITDRAYLAWTAAGADARETRRLRLRLADGTVHPVVGRWEFADNEMSAETATLLVRALFANTGRALVPNAYVTVLADEAAPREVVTVPTSAVVSTAQATGVWILGADGTVSFRDIVLGPRDKGRVRVDRGLKPGESVVVQGIHKLGEGIRVNVVPASEFH